MTSRLERIKPDSNSRTWKNMRISYYVFWSIRVHLIAQERSRTIRANFHVKCNLRMSFAWHETRRFNQINLVQNVQMQTDPDESQCERRLWCLWELARTQRCFDVLGPLDRFGCRMQFNFQCRGTFSSGVGAVQPKQRGNFSISEIARGVLFLRRAGSTYWVVFRRFQTQARPSIWNMGWLTVVYPCELWPVRHCAFRVHRRSGSDTAWAFHRLENTSRSN